MLVRVVWLGARFTHIQNSNFLAFRLATRPVGPLVPELPPFVTKVLYIMVTYAPERPAFWGITRSYLLSKKVVELYFKILIGLIAWAVKNLTGASAEDMAKSYGHAKVTL